MRVHQYVHAHRDVLNARLLKHVSLASYLSSEPEWRSPLAARDYVEFRDELWDELELERPTPQGAGFWPRQGPQWDAVARLEGKGGPARKTGVLLVEAKSHVGEDVTEIDRKTASTLKQRVRSMRAAQRALGVPPGTDWTQPRYQLANRLTFLYYLRIQRRIPAWLALVYFTGDQMRDFICPQTRDAWAAEIEASRTALNLPEHHVLSDAIISIFLPALDRPTRHELAIAVPPEARGPVTSFWAMSQSGS